MLICLKQILKPLRIVTWGYNTLLGIIIISYLKSCNCVKTNDYDYYSSCRAINTDLPDPLLPPVVHHSRKVFQATSCIDTELLYIGPSWTYCLCSSMWGGPQKCITYEFISSSPAVSRMSGSSLWGAAPRTCTIFVTAFLRSCRQDFSPCVSLASM